jgi:hypothetical protein
MATIHLLSRLFHEVRQQSPNADWATRKEDVKILLAQRKIAYHPEDLRIAANTVERSEQPKNRRESKSSRLATSR